VVELLVVIGVEVVDTVGVVDAVGRSRHILGAAVPGVDGVWLVLAVLVKWSRSQPCKSIACLTWKGSLEAEVWVELYVE
jgi:hypothetical protein